MDLSLERTVEVARRLGIAFTVPVITVAGTNGKGSTCAMIESIARHAGYRTGLYQKPELVHFEERCRIGGAPVAADGAAAALRGRGGGARRDHADAVRVQHAGHRAAAVAWRRWTW